MPPPLSADVAGGLFLVLVVMLAVLCDLLAPGDGVGGMADQTTHALPGDGAYTHPDW